MRQSAIFILFVLLISLFARNACPCLPQIYVPFAVLILFEIKTWIQLFVQEKKKKKGKCLLIIERIINLHLARIYFLDCHRHDMHVEVYPSIFEFDYWKR